MVDRQHAAQVLGFTARGLSDSSVSAGSGAVSVESNCDVCTPHYAVPRYLTALGSGGIKPCVSSFGGDQFRENSAKERSVAGRAAVE